MRLLGLLFICVLGQIILHGQAIELDVNYDAVQPAYKVVYTNSINKQDKWTFGLGLEYSRLDASKIELENPSPDKILNNKPSSLPLNENGFHEVILTNELAAQYINLFSGFQYMVEVNKRLAFTAGVGLYSIVYSKEKIETTYRELDLDTNTWASSDKRKKDEQAQFRRFSPNRFQVTTGLQYVISDKVYIAIRYGYNFIASDYVKRSHSFHLVTAYSF